MKKVVRISESNLVKLINKFIGRNDESLPAPVEEPTDGYEYVLNLLSKIPKVDKKLVKGVMLLYREQNDRVRQAIQDGDEGTKKWLKRDAIIYNLQDLIDAQKMLIEMTDDYVLKGMAMRLLRALLTVKIHYFI